MNNGPLSLWSLVRKLSQPLILAWVHREVGNPSNHSIVELWLEGFLLCYCGTIPVTEAPPPFRGVNGLLDSNQSAPSTLQHTDSVCAGPCIDSPISSIKWCCSLHHPHTAWQYRLCWLNSHLTVFWLSIINHMNHGSVTMTVLVTRFCHTHICCTSADTFRQNHVHFSFSTLMNEYLDFLCD